VRVDVVGVGIVIDGNDAGVGMRDVVGCGCTAVDAVRAGGVVDVEGDVAVVCDAVVGGVDVADCGGGGGGCVVDVCVVGGVVGDVGDGVGVVGVVTVYVAGSVVSDIVGVRIDIGACVCVIIDVVYGVGGV